MKNIFLMAAAGLALAVPAAAHAGGFACCNKGIHCQCPEPSCPDCSCPCDHGLHICTARKTERAHALIEDLHACDCCTRISAARKLGHRLCVDFCCDPEIVPALVAALLCDTCWEVRRAAAWSLAYQNARTPPAVFALYVASKLDPHYMVRDGATEAMGVLLVCRRDCFKDLFAAADVLIKELRGKYKPGAGECIALLSDACGQCGLDLGLPVVGPGQPVGILPPPKIEAVPAPLPAK